MLRLYILELTCQCILHLLHVSRLHMIEQGGDGLLRGDRGSGSMLWIPMINFLPLNTDALSRSPQPRPWIADVMRGLGVVEFLSPEGWFTDGHGMGNNVWAPPPAAADVVVEQLCLARHKHLQSAHMAVVPRLMTGHWRKHRTQATDFYFKIGNPDLWPLSLLFEPVLIFVCIPMLSHRQNFSWQEGLLGCARWLVLGASLHESHLAWFRNHLRELFNESREVCPL